ncbi:MAG: phospho-sugar mutase, partial [Acutalibacteraceae bacterium]
MKYSEQLELWLKNAVGDADLIRELEAVKENEAEVSDRFYKDLEFGTGGLRGVIGAGTNRMNIYTVGKATQGIADYVCARYEAPSVAVAYDSRIKSDLFARYAASVFAANGVKVYIYPELMPTPMLSYAVRYFGCSAGVNVTASHNPSKYNGYKVYGADGCQLNLDDAEYVLSIINKTDIFGGVRVTDFDEAVKSGMIEYIGEDCINEYLKTVKSFSVRPEALKNTDFSVVYTPLNGAGNKPVRAILDMVGIKNVTVVKSQELPDGNFPTAPYPNPEIRQAFEEALKVAADVHPDILLATDPDSDRVGIAVNQGGEYQLMSGNEVGVLLLDYILTGRRENGTLPERPVAVKTIVTSDLAAKIAEENGCEIRNVLTGFKFIGEQ